MSVGGVGWRLGITRRAYVAIEDGERPPHADEYEAICELFGWSDAGQIAGGDSPVLVDQSSCSRGGTCVTSRANQPRSR